MLDIKIFAKTIERLGDYYPKFELTDKEMETWYGYFKASDYDDFMDMVKEFINNSAYQPQSPTHLKQGGYNAKYIIPEPAWMKEQQRQFKKSLENDRKQLEEPVDPNKLNSLLNSFKN